MSDGSEIVVAKQSHSHDDELYKHLIQENAKYIEKVHQTWNQKLAIVGAMAAVIVVEDKGIAANSPIPLHLVILAIPVMCIMLDAHLLEKALQARIISHFIIRQFEDKRMSSPWCKTFWSIGDPSNSRNLFSYVFRFWFPSKNDSTIAELVGMRSATTALVSIVPTILVFLLAAWYGVRDDRRAYSVIAALIASCVYVAFAWLMFNKLRKKVQAEE